MKISFACDHGALTLRQSVIDAVRSAGHTLCDHGTDSAASVDYPDFAEKVCKDVQSGEFERGILLCTTGIGMSMAANKVRGIRAALVHHEDEVELTRRHNDANVLCMGALHTTPYEAARFVRIFLDTEAEGGRHARRVAKFCSTHHA